MKGGQVPSGETMKSICMGSVRRDYYNLVDHKRAKKWGDARFAGWTNGTFEVFLAG